MDLKSTPLLGLHQSLGAKLVPFAGYEMPVQYPGGIIKEHQHTRAAAGLFDVSHMGQVLVIGEHATQELETLMPCDLESLKPLHSTYSLLMNDAGGVRDDLIITRLAEDRFMVVVNAACKEADLAVLQAGCPSSAVSLYDDRALLALQGPKARDVMVHLAPDASGLVFMTGTETVIADIPSFVTCSGYTGEDGFEISMPGEHAETIANVLLEQEEVIAIGLGARDSLRLEAGLCLYGHELSEEISPVEAALRWAIAPARRPGGARAGGYPGADTVAQQMADGPGRVRVGFQVEGKRPVREGQIIKDEHGEEIGVITSGGFGPTVGAPVAMGFVSPAYKAIGTVVSVDVRGTLISARVVRLPMTPPGYHRG